MVHGGRYLAIALDQHVEAAGHQNLAIIQLQAGRMIPVLALGFWIKKT